jgi:hypothetical protein
VVVLYGRAGRLTAKSAGSGPGSADAAFVRLDWLRGYPRGAVRVISDCHFAVQLNHFISGFLSYSVAVFLKWQSDTTLGAVLAAADAPAGRLALCSMHTEVCCPPAARVAQLRRVLACPLLSGPRAAAAAVLGGDMNTMGPGPPGRSSALSIFLCKSGFYGAFVWARRARNRQKWWFRARAGGAALLRLSPVHHLLREGFGGLGSEAGWWAARVLPAHAPGWADAGGAASHKS